LPNFVARARCAAIAMMLCAGHAVAAQTEAASPPPPAPLGIDPATIPLPDLAFVPDAAAESNYDKYFYFHRADTDFATAYADLQECDGYARGLSFRVGNSPLTSMYAGTLGGALGGVIGNAIADAVFGSAERRRLRRVNMSTCMTFKEYGVFGLPKSLWETFNFEEGNVTIAEGRRQEMLRIQARVASGPAPRLGEIEQ
jgi:hypothetical protein